MRDGLGSIIGQQGTNSTVHRYGAWSNFRSDSTSWSSARAPQERAG